MVSIEGLAWKLRAFFSEGKIWEAAFFCYTQSCVYSAIRDMISESRFRFRGCQMDVVFIFQLVLPISLPAPPHVVFFASFFFLALQKRLPSNASTSDLSCVSTHTQVTGELQPRRTFGRQLTITTALYTFPSLLRAQSP